MAEREIRFRAWDSLHNKMLTDISSMRFGHNPTGSNVEQVYGYNPHIEATSDAGWVALNSLAVMQYTGLKDKKGVEIYEGDILSDDSQSERHGGRIATIVVSYNSSVGAFTYGTTNPSQGGKWYNFFNIKPARGLVPSENCKVIGNIYENPELLESSND